MRNNRLWRGLALAAVLAIASGCKQEQQSVPVSSQPGEAGTEATSTAKQFTIGFSQCTVKEPWRILFNKNLMDEAKKNPEVKLIVLDADDQTEMQVAQMRTFIRQKVNAILISPKEAPGLTAVVAEATDAGIPVILLDRGVNSDKYAAFIGGDNLKIGRAAGREAVRLLGGPGNAKGVIYEICGGLATPPAQERRGGFHEIVEKEPGIKIIGGLDADWKKDRAQNILQDALKANPEIDLVYAHNDPMAHGAYLAAKAAGRADKIKFIGIDANPDEGRRWVRTGEITATFLYPTPGEKGLQVALDILNGKPVEKKYTLPTRLFNKDNIEQGGELVE
ncbi:MAG TPA: substrate-binding domain-containing protein [Phycisphaerae bacterium]|nr:substrate-binding domain-containing protein [Phycisphaerae bacterium]